jgi:RHS repeat-associated protein
MKNKFFSLETIQKLISIILIESMLFSSLPTRAYAVTDAVKITDTVMVKTDQSEDIGKSGKIHVKEVVREKINEKTEKVITYKNVKIEIPEGAVKGDAEITVEELTKIEDLNPGMENATGGAIGYRFKPDGMKFAKEIKITLPFNKEKYKDVEDASEIYTYFYNVEDKYWEKLPRIAVDVKNGVVTSLTTHFTDMINSTLKLPDSPKPLSFNPNSIKDIKAANPLSNIPNIQGLEADPYGAASFNIPLTLPPGRNGLVPKIAIDYNSGASDGWLGVGFDVSLPCITIDTKFGVPSYNGNETYLFNGSELVKTEDEKDGTSIFKQRIEGNFSYIKRYGSNATNYYFLVIDKSGTKYYYGYDAIKKEINDAVSKSDQPKSKNAIYKWYLKNVIDTNGNNIIYYYINNENYVYPSSIYYTGYNGSNGNYSVTFENEGRDDVMIDCRGKFVSKQKLRLKNIRIYYKSDLIRRYEFTYSYNDFFKSQISKYSEYAATKTVPFYSYEFKYRSIKEKEKLLQGYKDIAEIDNFNKPSSNIDYSFGGGGALYVGLGLVEMCSVGLNIGFDLDYSFNNSTLIDVNGDGLPDFIQKDLNSSALKYKLNTTNIKTNSFSFANENLMSGFETLNNSLMSETKQVGFDVGVSGGLNYVATGSFGGKFDWSFGLSTFADIDGDGIVDYIPSNYYMPVRDYYLKGTGNGFKKVFWGTNEPATAITGLTDASTDKVKNSLYLVDPVIKWKPYRRGVINMNSIVQKTEEGALENGYDGIKIDIYRNDTSILDVGSNNILTSSTGNASKFMMNKDLIFDTTSDSLYFKADSRDNVNNDRISWDIDLAYKKIYFRDDMKNFYDTTYDLAEKYTIDDFTNILEKITDTGDKNTFRSVYDNVYDKMTGKLSGYSLKTGLSEKQKSPVRQILIKYGIRIRRYYKYNNNLFEVQKSGSSYYIEIPDPIRNLSSNAIVQSGNGDSIGTVTAKGLLYDVGVDENGNITKRKWLKDKGGNNVELYVEDSNGTSQVSTSNYTVTRTTSALTLNEMFEGYKRTFTFDYDKNDLYKFQTIDGAYFLDLSNDINQNPDNTYDLTKCYSKGIDGNYSLNSGYDAAILDIITGKIKKRGIAHYEDRTGLLVIYNNICYDVTEIDNPGNITEETVNNQGTETCTGAKTSYIYEDDFNNDGTTLYKKKYIHVFSRKSDFTLSDITKSIDLNSLLKDQLDLATLDGKLKYLRDKNEHEDSRYSTNKQILLKIYNSKSKDGKYYILDKETASRQIDQSQPMTYGQSASMTLYNLGYADDYFSGGVYNWYYGEWDGAQSWDTSKFGIVDEVNNFAFLTGLNKMSAYVDDSKGGNANKLGVDAWKGSEFGYTDRKGDSEGNIKDISVYYACYVTKDFICSSRKGGDTIKYIPAESGIAASGMAEYIRQGFSWSINTGANIFNASFNYSYNRSISTKDFMDMNGDGYPDEVKENLGSGTLEVTYNRQGKGFGGYTTYNVFPDFRVTTTNVLGIGVGLSSQMIAGWAKVFKDPRQATAAVRAGSKQSPTLGVGGGGTVSGNFDGAMTTVDWIDINGDGLTDQIYRDPYLDAATTGYFKVKLNIGDDFVDEQWSTSSWSQAYSFLTSNEVIRNNVLYGGNFSGTVGMSVANLSVGPSVDFSLSVGFSGNTNCVDIMDMNGDGLPDQVFKWNDTNFLVKLNMGDRFSEEIEWDAIKNWNKVSGLDLGDIVTPAINRMASQTGKYLGGDGGVNSVKYDYNGLTNGIQENGGKDVNIMGLNDALTYNSTFNLGLGLDVGLGIPIMTDVELNLSLSGNFAFSTTGAYLQMMDINGDGLPDHVLSYNNRLFAKINNAGMSGLLDTIITPQGGTINLGYERTQNTVDMPQSKYVMISVTRNDGMGSSYTVTNEYINPKYDRVEREYYGHEYVKTTNPNGTYTLNQYYIDPSSADLSNNARDYYTKGLLIDSKFCNSAGRILTEEQSTYELVLEGSYSKAVIFPRVKESRKKVVDDNGQSVTTAMSYDSYDEYGNVKQATDRGDVSKSDDDILIKIDYAHDMAANKQSLTDKYILSLPYSIDVRDANNTNVQLRYREAVYNDNGEMTALRQYRKESNEYSITNLEYDTYGNLSKITDPNGYYIGYSYDTDNNTYMTQIRDSGNYASSATYDYRLGVDLVSTDVGGNSLTKQYDDFGRLSKVFTSYDKLSGTPAIEFGYYLDTFPFRAVTKNKIHYDSSNSDTLDTVIVTDGLGRVIQTKKEGEVIVNNVKTYGMNVSGPVVYDNMGRVKKQGQPLFQADTGDDLYQYWTGATLNKPTVNTYDDMGRVTTVTLSDGNAINTDYSISSDGLFVTKVTDPMGKTKTSYSDANENIIKMEQINGGKLITTKYEYDLLNEITEVKDTKNNTTTITYDSLGRRTGINNPDSGLIEYTYDLAGNLIKKVDPNLRTKRIGIEYEYDHVNNRLSKIKYPESSAVTYNYGAANSGNNAGRITSVVDGSGTTVYNYGELGEQTSVTRTMKSLKSGEADAVWTSSYLFDYLGRMENITYPDGEKLTYTYDRGGFIKGVTGTHRNTGYTYVSDIGYDEFGQRLYIKYGNGTQTNYTYDPDRRWLENIVTKNSSGKCFQNMAYTFDKVGNILSTVNTGYKQVTQTYSYDDLYQLTGASGTYRNTEDPTNRTTSYKQTFAYDETGNMTSKTSAKWKDPGTLKTADLNYKLAYSYSVNNPHRAIQIGEWKYEYDGNGNVTKISPESTNNGVISGTLTDDGATDGVISGTLTDETDNGEDGVLSGTLTDETDETTTTASSGGTTSESCAKKKTELTWNEENRLVQSNVGGEITKYLYDAGGERTVKQGNKSETIYVDKFYQTQDTVTGEKYIVTKHIFVGDTRIVSKLSHYYGSVDDNKDIAFEQHNQYYYHADHLGSTTFVSDYQGKEYQHTEYAPYGESWVDEESDQMGYIKYLYTSKELDSETGFYYFGARYLDPQVSRWMSADPAMNGYLNTKSGEGGIYNSINLSMYNYAGNNPLSYIDPNGLIIQEINRYKADVQRQWAAKNVQLGNNTETRSGNPMYNLHDYGCYVTALTNILNSFYHDKYKLDNDKVYTIFDSNNVKDAFRSGDGNVNGMAGSLKILNQNENVKSLGIEYMSKTPDKLSEYANDKENLYFVVGEISLNGGQHYFNILTAPDANGDYWAWDGWQIGSPYVKKNVRDLTGIRVFKIPNKNLIEQAESVNTTGKNPKKAYLEKGK